VAGGVALVNAAALRRPAGYSPSGAPATASSGSTP
jgi:hypothetical protein